MAATPSSEVFRARLNSLCLRDFPCEYSQWTQRERKKYSKGEVIHYESKDSLKELIKSKVWNHDFKWSREASELRELAIKSPWLIDDEFIRSYFKTLRFVDEKITQIDEGMLQLVSLEELTLSANNLVTIESKNLPKSLQVLELCANQISDLTSLCRHPLPLRHLGLGYNRISSLRNYFSSNSWPHLLSLDLSYNNLTNLPDVMATLALLPKLRNLVLQGNPLSFSPAYRGAFIDAIRSLTSLDDILITADEKHHYKGISKCQDPLFNGACVLVCINLLNNLRMPEELKGCEPHIPYPVIEYKYSVEFTIPESNQPTNDQNLYLHYGRVCKPLGLDENPEAISRKHDRRRQRKDYQDKRRQKRQESPRLRKLDADGRDGENSDGALKSETFVPEAVQLQPSKFLIDESGYPLTDWIMDSRVAEKCNINDSESGEIQNPSEKRIQASKTWVALDGISFLPTSVHSASTQGHIWSERMNYAFEYLFTCYDLAHLRDYFAQGITLAVIESRRYGFLDEVDAINYAKNRYEPTKDIDTADTLHRPRSTSSTGSRNEKLQVKTKKDGVRIKTIKDRDKDHLRDRETQKDKEYKDYQKDHAKDVKRGRKKDKKQTDERNLFYTPVEKKCIAKTHLSLVSLWDGEMSVHANCICTNLDNEGPMKALEQDMEAVAIDAPIVEIIDTNKRNAKRRESTEVEFPIGQRLNKRRDSSDKTLLLAEKKTDDGNKMRRPSFSKEEERGNEINPVNRGIAHNVLRVDEKSNHKAQSNASSNKSSKSLKNEEKNKKVTVGQKVDIEEETVNGKVEYAPISIDAEIKLLRWKTAAEAYENKLWHLNQKQEHKIEEG
ncbi:uncharacterized protein TRIADDRAFT_59717 [Trichoplax adhaerens]|uniref:Leucine-rich repeat-containing protein 43 n=1 Tax=Trichoplax adhaerens TaxID=10228 RepID=B3S687_TRIAD|nr:hypothetical protein TRIADDRAFT_59717 [Trichoplax adhaerens]EDV21715.1 hypothetical protein TRIADDRAFT_59717 [Trichoplax adhaerens]|eukprot:XP_002115863.1 hypothetical protein TRIADDRAFT_59717 [Trichoplax adhaerens]